MKPLVIALALVLTANLSPAQSPEEAAFWAQQITKSAGKLKNVAFRTPLDLHASVLFKQDETAALIMPAQGLNRERIKQSGTKPVPLGVLWFLGVKPSTRKHAPFAADKLQTATINSNGQHRLHGVLLAIRQNGEHKELLVFGRGQQPLLKIPVTEMPLHQRRHIDMLASGKDERGFLTLHLFGAFLVRIPVVTAGS